MVDVPSTLWRMLAQRTSGKELPKGLDAIWDAAFGVAGRTVPRLRRYLRRAVRVLALEADYKDMGDGRLREAAAEMRITFRLGRNKPADLERAFAIVREVAARQLGERPFLVQVAGAFALEAGCIAEMATGEGKTLTATLPATIAGWKGWGCHVITVNDYLAKRDAEWMAKLYHFCGLSVASIEQKLPPPQRREAYQADITYCTNKEVTADFLRDRLALGRLRGATPALLAKIAQGTGSGTDRLVQRGLAYALIDEADSILIDEAVTPLIISGEAPNAEQVESFRQAVDLAASLEPRVHYRVNHRYREVDLTAAGKRRVEELAEPLGGFWKGTRRREELVTQVLTARELYLRDKQYVVAEDKIVIVDEFTGRLMPDRTWRDGLHQAVEAKEGITVNPPKDTYARLSFQRFFRMYRKLAGMTGTAAEAWREFWQIYHLPVVTVPTNRPCIRKVRPDRVFANEAAKWDAVVLEIKRLHATGRPILVGTRSVRASEFLSGRLAAEELPHEVLNAVRHAEEAQIVAGAGQGDPGSAQALVCLEDELVRRHSPHVSGALRKRYGRVEREISSAFMRRLFDAAQRRAERQALRQRKSVLRTDDWLDEYLGFAGREA